MQIEMEAYIGQIAQWLRICMLPEVAGSTHWLLLLRIQRLHRLLIPVVMPDYDSESPVQYVSGSERSELFF